MFHSGGILFHRDLGVLRWRSRDGYIFIDRALRTTTADRILGRLEHNYDGWSWRFCDLFGPSAACAGPFETEDDAVNAMVSAWLENRRKAVS